MRANTRLLIKAGKRRKSYTQSERNGIAGGIQRYRKELGPKKSRAKLIHKESIAGKRL